MTIAKTLLTAADVHLFYDEAFTDTTASPGDNADAEASELLQSIESFGHNITTFVGTGEQWITAAHDADVIAVPNLDTDLFLDPAAAHEVIHFVDAGGTMIIVGGVNGNHTTDLINALFGKSFVEKDLVSTLSSQFDDVGTYAGGPTAIGDSNGNDYTSAWTAASLPDYVTSLYQDGAGDSTVAAFQYGRGQIVWLGWNWSNALPSLGTQDDGWLEVLNRSISRSDLHPNGNEIVGTNKRDKVGAPDVARKFAATNLDDIISVGKGKDKVKAGDGHDTIFGGKGKDKLSGQDGPDTLVGGPGRDTLKGGAGIDDFVFNGAIKRKNLDKIKDFDDLHDILLLSQKIFTGLTVGAMSATQFDDHIDYTGKGQLKYDGKAFAKLSPGLDIDHTDFLVV
jgi:Ca2+-binding RTX toxin-like protein